MGALPRGACQYCGADVALRLGDLAREHRNDGTLRYPCAGSGLPAEPGRVYPRGSRLLDVNGRMITDDPTPTTQENPNMPTAPCTGANQAPTDDGTCSGCGRDDLKLKANGTMPTHKPPALATVTPINGAATTSTVDRPPTPAEEAAAAADPDPHKPARYADAPHTPGAGELVDLAVDSIDFSPDNPRRSMDPDELDQLAASIRSLGVLEPVIVTPIPGNRTTGPTHELVAGARRLSAARLAGLATIPAIVRPDLTGTLADEARLIENLQRADLTPLEEADAFRRLLDLGYTQLRLADRIGRNQGHISKRLALLKLPADVQAAVALPKDDPGHIGVAEAVELAKVADRPAVLREAMTAATGGRPGDVERIVARANAEAKKRKAIDDARAELEAAGVAVVDLPRNGWWNRGDTRNDRPLADQDHPGYLGDTVAFDGGAELHKGMPCRAVALDDQGRTIELCVDPATHGWLDPTAEKDAQAAARAAAEEAKAKESARHAKTTAKRWAHLVALVAKQPAKAIVVDYLATFALVAAGDYYDVAQLAARLLFPDGADSFPIDADDDLAEVWLRRHADTNPAAKLQAGWAFALAAGEDSYRHPWAQYLMAAYVDVLDATGYKLTADDRKRADKAKADHAASSARILADWEEATA